MIKTIKNSQYDMDKKLEEAVFLANCGLEYCKDGTSIIGVTRLEIARDLLNESIAQINSIMDAGKFAGYCDNLCNRNSDEDNN